MVVDALVTGGLIIAAVVAAIFVARLLVGFARDQPISEAVTNSGRFTAALFGAMFAVIAMLIQNFADVLDALGGFIGMHPFGVTNLITIGLGSVGLSGFIDVSPTTWLVATLGLAAVALVVSEVY
jgi:hypothetical protein